MSDFAIPFGLLVVLVATGFTSAAALRLPSLFSTLLAAYVAVVAETALLTTVLSPFRAVTRGWLGAIELVLLAIALGVWQRRGRPSPALRHLPRVLGVLARDPATALLLVVVVGALVYELVLGLTVPPNNGDSLAYHLTRAAAWAQHGGVYWIPNAPTARVNEFQPLAEQELLYLFVATGKGALYAFPQYFAELAIVAAIYLGARRLDFGLRQAACAALLFASLPLVALEASTSQNDLVAASLPAAAAALLLGTSEIEFALAGAAAALGLGVKLTTALVLPVLVLLALNRGRRALRLSALSGVAVFVVVAVWGYVLNLSNTGHVLGHGGGRVEQQASPSLTGSPSTAFRVLYKLIDLSGLSGRLILAFALLGLLAGVGTFFGFQRRGGLRAGGAAAAVVAFPLLAPRLEQSVAHVLHLVANAVSLPVEARATTGGPFVWGVGYVANEDFSGFGPIGGLALLAVSLFALTPWGRRRLGNRLALLGLALPLFVVFLALTSKYNPWLNRFLLVPVALAAPLFAAIFRRREAALAIAVVATVGLVGVELHNGLKPLRSGAVAPWRLTQAQAYALTGEPGASQTASFAAALPRHACVGAVLGPDDPSYFLFGPHLSRKVTFLLAADAVSAARQAGLAAVVIGQAPNVSSAFGAAGWRLGGPPASSTSRFWTLATAPGASSGTVGSCPRSAAGARGG